MKPIRRKKNVVPLLTVGAAEGLMAQEAYRRYGGSRKNPPPPGDPDHDLAVELVEFTMNDAELYRARVTPFVKNYARRVAKGTFDKDAGIRGLANNLARDAYRQYWAEHGGPGRTPALSGPTKWRYGQLLMEWLMDEVNFEVEEMRTTRKNPRSGKFELSGDDGENLHQMTMEGWQDDELGDVQGGFGWHALLIDTILPDAQHVIVHEDEDGFFDFTTYPSKAAAERAWERLQEQYDAYSAPMEGEDEDGIFENPRRRPGRPRNPSKRVRPVSPTFYCRKCLGYHRRNSKIGKKHSKSDATPRRSRRTVDCSCNMCGDHLRNVVEVREHFKSFPDHNDMSIP